MHANNKNRQGRFCTHAHTIVTIITNQRSYHHESCGKNIGRVQGRVVDSCWKEEGGVKQFNLNKNYIKNKQYRLQAISYEISHVY